MLIRIYYTVLGSHVHMALHSGSAKTPNQTFAYCGTLTMSCLEFNLLRELLSSIKPITFINRMEHPDHEPSSIP